MAFCLGNLVELLHQILHPIQYHQDWVLDSEKIPQIQSLLEDASFLRYFLAESSPAIQAEIETLEDQIRDAAEHVEDILESYIKAQVLSNPVGQSFMIYPPDLTQICHVFSSAAKEMINIKAAIGHSEKTTPGIHSRSDPSHLTPDDHVLVGMDKCLIELRDRLTSQSRALEIIPIVGMGGIGKTTLARKLFNHYSSGKHFDICLWETILQDYDQRQVLLSLLCCYTSDKKAEELKVDIHKKLYTRRYLIVLDDVWSSRVWDDIHTCAPDNNNKSRIILTTRENWVANYVSPRRYEVQLLNKEDSWELFEKIVHPNEKCPSELEEIAREIVRKCGGLPFAIQVIGGFMSRAKRTKGLWEKVAGDISSFITKEDNRFSGIFSWSYANLPHYLKPCLLYIGAFPEDHAIEASRLIKLWVAEGFLNPIKDTSPEEVAELHLNALVDRNLIFVRKRTFNERVYSYGIHDLLRDLCMRKAEEKKFIFAKKVGEPVDALRLRRVCVTSSAHIDDLSDCMDLMTQARSFQLIGRAYERVFPKSGFEFSLLNTLDLRGIYFKEFAKEILKLINLKYLGLSFGGSFEIELPPSIGVLKNLQTIIFGRGGKFPVGIFSLPQLRHFKFSPFVFEYGPVPSSLTCGETLQTLSNVPVGLLTQLLGKLPSLKSLGILGKDWETEPNIDLTSFPKLECLTVYFSNYLNPIFPQALRELYIHGAKKLSGAFMSRIGALPNLQLLRLYECEFESSTWEPSEGEFCNLQYLCLQCSNLENWIADETHFPQLKHLFIGCRHLKEIPLEIGGIETLEKIILYRFKDSVQSSARSILQEQRDFGNLNFHLSGEYGNAYYGDNRL